MLLGNLDIVAISPFLPVVLFGFFF